MPDQITQEMRDFLRKVEDFGRLSGEKLRSKYGCDPMEGYEWLAKEGRALTAKLDKPDA